MGRIFDSLFKSKDEYLNMEINNHNRKNLSHLPVMMINSFCDNYNHYVQNTVISGGNISSRFPLEKLIIDKAISSKTPVVIVHCNNSYIERFCTDVNGANYDPIVGKTPEEIACLLTESYRNIYNGEQRIYGILELIADIISKIDVISYGKLVNFNSNTIPQLLFDLENSGLITDLEHLNYLDRHGNVSENIYEQKFLFEKLKSYSNHFNGKSSRIEDILRYSEVLKINIESDTNNLLKELIFSDIARLLNEGKKLLLVTDGLSLLNRESNFDNVLLRTSGNASLMFAADDVPRMTQQNPELFHTLLGGNTNVAILQHSNNDSALKWADYIGQHYEKIIEMNQGLSKENLSIIRKTNSSSITTREDRRYVIPPESIRNLREDRFFILQGSTGKIMRIERGGLSI